MTPDFTKMQRAYQRLAISAAAQTAEMARCGGASGCRKTHQECAIVFVGEPWAWVRPLR